MSLDLAWRHDARTDDEPRSSTGIAPGRTSLTARLAPVFRRAAPTPRPTPEAGATSAPAAIDPLAPFALHLTGGGDPLPAAVRTRAEASLGVDLGGVRVHTGDDAAARADAVGALAYAQGQDIHFARGHYAPGTPAGDHLLAHELAHTVQQRAGAAPQHRDAISQPGDALEREADAAADAIVAGRRFAVSAGSAPDAPIQRVPRPTTALNNGMITRELTVTLHPGGPVTLHAGTYVEVVREAGATLHVRVHSGHRGAEADLPRDAFRAEAEIGDASSATADSPDQRIMYRDFRGALWGPAGPVLADVDQGAIGDCYLLAALGAIVTANPAHIRNMIAPHTPGLDSYQVSIHEYNPSGRGVRPRTWTIDTNFPVLADARRRASTDLAYAGNSTHATPGARGAPPTLPALWPLLLEKAYAYARGGYQNLDNDQHRRRGRTAEGQNTNNAMELLLGARAETNFDPTLDREARQIRAAVGTGGTPTADENAPLRQPNGALAPLLQSYLTRHIAVELSTVAAPVSTARHGGAGLVDPADASLAHLYLSHEYVLERVAGTLIHVYNPHGAGGQIARGFTEDEVRRYFSSITISSRPVADR